MWREQNDLLNIRFKPSVILGLLLVLAHASAVGLLLVVPLPIWSKLVTVVVVCISFAFYFRRNARLAAPSSLVALEIKEDCACTVETRNGNRRSCTVLPTSYVSASLTILNLKVDGKLLRKHLVILPDAVNAEDFRKLRVLLRWRFKSRPTGAI
ncbi:MAG TPA: protein YgfX [Burkholderiales bacterium]|nr:protein YgfX [Burkholderiales bacterium]